MPKAKKYTRAQMIAYYKRGGSRATKWKNVKKKYGVKKPKRAVVKQNQFRTEFKDRVSPISQYTIAANPESWDNTKVPLDSEVLFPYAFFNYFSQGTQNGEIDGNQINARYLNMKVEMDFSDLPTLVRTSETGQINVDQNYYIVIRQCYVLEDLSEHLNKSYLNVKSGRTIPAFNAITGGTEKIPLELLKEVANKALNRQKLKADFLTYQRRQDTKVRVLKKIVVKGKLNQRLVNPNDTAIKVEVAPTDSGESTVLHRPYPTPNQHFTFNWKMPKNKIQLQPAIGTTTGDPPETEVAGYWPGKSWIPCVMVSCERDESDHDIANHPLRISQISHFTYTDN
jgi:hypothetical protein